MIRGHVGELMCERVCLIFQGILYVICNKAMEKVFLNILCLRHINETFLFQGKLNLVDLFHFEEGKGLKTPLKDIFFFLHFSQPQPTGKTHHHQLNLFPVLYNQIPSRITSIRLAYNWICD